MANSCKEHKRGVPRPPPLSLFIGREQEPAGTRTHPAAADNSNKKRMLSKQLSMKETTREVKWEKRRRQIQRQRSSMGLYEADRVGCAHTHATANAVTDEDLDELKGSMELGFGFNEENGGQNLCDTLPALDLYFAVNRQDLDELKGSMELGFGFNEENGGQNLCDTLPALDLYFAVNRQLSEPKMRVCSRSLPSLSVVTSSSSMHSGTPSPAGSPTAQPSLLDSLKISSPAGENPQLIKTRLRQWAQAWFPRPLGLQSLPRRLGKSGQPCRHARGRSLRVLLRLMSCLILLLMELMH
ncbi:hypothetical protein TRIUR3_29245 [Triticum urartu]|uniref:Uncharacterized protein n=1 Tax=Triticum urartu TaxID=4572 RepID=M7ZH61_TRIUA|nr:hypothetical protein TRIUR3_29245 [Triticum urartu]